mgnify:CR=1 FL=1
MRMHKLFLIAGLACTVSLNPLTALADEHSMHIDHEGMHHSSGHETHNHNDLVPIGMMGSHMHKKGDWMVSYRYMHMDMDGNRDGTSRVDPVTIATTEANRFFGMTGQPSTLRVVPTDMSMEMHMFGAMYAPSDWLTLMAMINFEEKEMDHITFAGGMGTTVLGNFTTKSEGWSDTKLTGLIRLFEDDMHHVHANLGLSLPTGSIDEEATVLTPMGMRPKLRMPYAMQLGTGTFDLLPGLTYSGHKGDWGWGAQYSAEIRLEDENSEGYAWGDKHSLSAWGAYQWTPWISTSARVTGTTQDSIDGIDSQIMAPVQTADPDNYGGEVIELGLGINLYGQVGVVKGHKVAIEATAPLYRDLNGPQLETDMKLTIGWQYSF